jgi:hypothetical protein
MMWSRIERAIFVCQAAEFIWKQLRVKNKYNHEAEKKNSVWKLYEWQMEYTSSLFFVCVPTKRNASIFKTPFVFICLH